MKKVIVGLSGGVDSSVASYLLKKEGYNVHAVFMVNWKEKGACNWEEDIRIAREVARKLSIPLQIWDFASLYTKYVFEDFISAYLEGLTPNPDVFCNKYIKFGSFYQQAMKEGADFVATGHYAQIKQTASLSHGFIVNNETMKQSNNVFLCSAVDKTKDQSDFLYQIKPSQLKHVLFPVGEMHKTQVKELARSLGLPSWNKPESMGVCFIGEINMKVFLQKYIPPKKGMIYDTAGGVMGTHEGVWYYTLGQREGLKLGGTGPYFVVKKNVRKNILIVAKEPEAGELLSVEKVELGQVNFFLRRDLMHQTSISGMNVLWRDRHLAPLEKGTLRKEKGKWLVEFEHPKRGVTPGQSLVMYDRKGEMVVGGGVIMKTQ